MGHVVVEIVTVVLWIYWLLLMFRLVMSWVFQFARSYDPHGVMLVAVESAYTATDPRSSSCGGTCHRCGSAVWRSTWRSCC